LTEFLNLVDVALSDSGQVFIELQTNFLPLLSQAGGLHGVKPHKRDNGVTGDLFRALTGRQKNASQNREKTFSAGADGSARCRGTRKKVLTGFRR